MWHRSVVCWVIAIAVGLLACSSDEPKLELTVPLPKPAPPHTPEPPPPTGPHGAPIVLSAITDEGDAALTIDELGKLRIWLTLDGRSEPRVVRASAPKGVVLTRDGVALLVGILDAAGGIELVVLDREARVTHRVRLPAEPPCVELYGVPGGVLALRADQSITWYDARGTSRGRIVPDAGTRIASVSVRRGRAVALIATETTTPLRWIELTDRLLWGKTVELPVVLERVALAPGHRRIAGTVKSGATAMIIDLEPAVRINTADLRISALRRVGFVDDDHAIVAKQFEVEWWVAPPLDPWAPLPATTAMENATVAVGDRIAVGGAGAMLVVAEPNRTRYLGYREVALGFVASAGDHVTLNSGGHLIWLDRQLQILRATTKADEDLSVSQPIGEHHVLTSRSEPSEENADGIIPMTIAVRDLVSGAMITITKLADYSTVTYDPSSRVLAVATETKAERYRLDLTANTATKLRPLALHTGASVHSLDPALANGVVAVTIGYDGDDYQQRIDTYQLADQKDVGGRAIRIATTAVLEGSLIGIDRAGVVYLQRISETNQNELVGVRDGKQVSRVKLEFPTARGALSRDGTVAVFTTATAVIAMSPMGMSPMGMSPMGMSLPPPSPATPKGRAVPALTTAAILWRFPAWGTQNATFSGDDRSVIVQAQGGLIALDTATGTQLAQSCGWNFGVFDTAITQRNNLGLTTVCEEEVTP